MSAPLTIVPYDGSSTRKKRKRARPLSQGQGVLKTGNACTACREKKTRCSGQIPCDRCRRQNHDCRYMPTSRRHHSSVNDIQAAIERSPTNISNVPIDMSGSTILIDTPDEALHQDQYGHFHGGSSGFSFMELAKRKLSSLPPMSMQFPDYPLAGSGDLAPMLPPRAVADDLVQTYFEFGLTTFRFVHEPSLLISLDRFYNDQQLPADERALVLMVMTLGSHYSKQVGMFCGYTASVRFYDMADALLRKDASKITFAALQARVLVIHFLLSHSRMHEAWSSFGIVIRHTQALGLHRRSFNTSNRIFHELRKRVFWTVYINDRLLSSVFGRPCTINDDDVDQEQCSLANDQDISVHHCYLTERSAFCFTAALVHYARLAKILGNILRKFYSPMTRLHSINRLRESAIDMEKCLIAWNDDLPAYLDYVSLPPSAMSTTSQRQLCTLKLFFVHTSLLLYRPFILHSINSSSRTSMSEFDQWIKHCHDKSIEAAKLAVSECQYLSQRGMFSRAFWLVNYVQFAAVGTLFMYSQLWPQAKHVREIAVNAHEEFPIGVDGDSVGQRYLQILTELRHITAPGIGGINSEALQQASIASAHNLNNNPSIADQTGDLDHTLLDFGGPWSHDLFFDMASLEEYMGGSVTG